MLHPPREAHLAPVELARYRGRKLALCFYPRDETSGCTTPACNLRDNIANMSAHNIAVVDVSADSIASHDRFAAKYALPFPLLADAEKKIVRDYGVEGEKKAYGRTYVGILRTTFLIDEDGIIVRALCRPKPADHAAEILRGFGIAG